MFARIVSWTISFEKDQWNKVGVSRLLLPLVLLPVLVLSHEYCRFMWLFCDWRFEFEFRRCCTVTVVVVTIGEPVKVVCTRVVAPVCVRIRCISHVHCCHHLQLQPPFMPIFRVYNSLLYYSESLWLCVAPHCVVLLIIGETSFGFGCCFPPVMFAWHSSFECHISVRLQVLLKFLLLLQDVVLRSAKGFEVT